MPNPENNESETEPAGLSRTLRPLGWWLLLVLGLFGLHQHQLAMERTRINFSVFMQGQNVVANTAGTLDGEPMTIGQKISLGHHTLTLSNPKAEPFTTNFFCWYGGQNYGQINLIRSMGTVNIMADPAAPVINLTGPEFSLTLTNSTGTNLTLPTDSYEIQALYPRWSRTINAIVANRQTAYCNFLPRYGALQLSCNREGATYQLQKLDGQEIDSGNLPATITELPADDYQATVYYHNLNLKKQVFVSEKFTNDLPINFYLGTAHLESDPDGATVETLEGAYLGQTPLNVIDLLPQPVQFRLTKPGYESATVNLDIVANQTTTYRTNLIGANYRGAMQVARQALAVGNYHGAAQAVEEALAAKPGDADALEIKKETDKYLAAERLEQEKYLRPRKLFDALCADYPDSGLFKEYELKTSLPAQDVSTAIVRSLQTSPHAFDIRNSWASPPDGYETVAHQSFSLGFLGGTERVCLLVVGQSKPGETEIFFKVLEFEIQTDVQSNGLLSGQAEKKLIPVDPSRLQMNDLLESRLRDGVQIVLEKLRPVLRQP